MPDNALTILEHQLAPLAPRLDAALSGLLPVSKLIQSVLISVERTPRLMDCTPDSILRSAMSLACLGLPADGVTGQAFLVPFRDHGIWKAQTIIGYKGYSTLGARGDLTVTGAVVMEGDPIEYDIGTGQISHRPPLTNRGRRIVGTWAKASHIKRPPILVVLGIDEIMEIKSRIPNAKNADSVWNFNFPAMAEKTGKRRLSRSIPIDSEAIRAYHIAARMDEAVEEEGKAAYITPERGLEIDGKAAEIGHYEAGETPAAAELTGPDPVAETRRIARDEGPEAAQKFYDGLSDADKKRVDAKRRKK